MRLYALCDQELLDTHNVTLEEFVEIAKQNSAEIIQYRNKKSDSTFIRQQLIRIRKQFNGFLIVNDAYGLIEFCDGVHLGQEDLKQIDSDFSKAVKVLRNIVSSDKIIGLSTHNEVEVIQANKLDLNYIGLGALRSTSTKKDVLTVLGDELDLIASKSKHFVAAIGGVQKSDQFTHVTYHVIGSGLLL